MSTTNCILILALAIVSASHFATVLYGLHALRHLLPPPHEYTYIGDDFPAQLPLKLPPAALVLETGAPHYALLSDADWGTVFPPGNGFVGLGPHNRTFLVSMLHQLHCLDVIRVGFLINRTDDAVHVQHCLRYMLQIVLCQADTTLERDEPGKLDDGTWEHGASGVGAVHRCRDWTVLRDWIAATPPGPVEISDDETEAR
ncbi:hypothetical protein C8Q76DRAFT_794959 [Earliella scabrosa]|nr:hypothetical protein C8Q76DRAFT_794959 [Earliella scabrosa]